MNQGIIDLMNPSKIASALFNIVFIIVPGFAIIFFYYKDLFISLELFKLLFLSMMFSAPFILINFFATQEGSKINKNSVSPKLTLPIFASALVVYLSLIIAKPFRFNLNYFLITTVCVEFISVLILWRYNKWLKHNEFKQN
jgi:energy-coupling factor transporter transmembrane protein EcfT